MSDPAAVVAKAGQLVRSLEVSCSQGYLPVAISGFALIVSFGSAYLAFRKNRNDLSTPWVTMLLRHVEEEFKAVDLHAVVFKQVCCTPFPDPVRKREVVGKLYELREDSSRRLSGLCALVPSASELRDKRAALDGVADSYFDNDSLKLCDTAASSLRSRYDDNHREYLQALRRFAKQVWLREALF